ncbi:helix-hairpin-helix domain-containing protein [Thermopolyspora sp. NPDC052614]|uniref:ComEA family DNA-binding protein n=1 Tax=Thermopolyspora sp. NPDC052614 TaxID=3155682 RepID=UPI003423F7CC
MPVRPKRPAPDIYPPPPPPAPEIKDHFAPRHPPAPRPPTPRPPAPRPPRPNNPRYYPGPHQHGPQPPPPPAAQPSSGASILWALTPLFTCGFGTPFTMAYGAARLKSRGLALAAVIYGLGLLVFWFGVGLDAPEVLRPLMALAYMGNWLGGTVHSFMIHRKVFGLPGSEAPMTANERAIALAQHRRNLRKEARELAAGDPALAKELRIGRPDLPRQYDDGGLVDVNHAPVEVIATLPGMTRELAQKIVDVRETVEAFISAEELSATVGLPPQLTADLAEYTIYLN